MPDNSGSSTTIQPLSADSFAELLQFERENRAYFAEWIADRGDDYFTDFARRNQALLEEQATGDSYFFLIRDAENRLVGRVNLVDVADHSATLGYRVAQAAAGLGHAGRAVSLACGFARDRGLHTITAMTSANNHGSRKVLERARFARVDLGPSTMLHNGSELELVHYSLALPSS
ncbi:MAG: GNAT family protein [Homoserinimonas sp.]